MVAVTEAPAKTWHRCHRQLTRSWRLVPPFCVWSRTLYISASSECRDRQRRGRESLVYTASANLEQEKENSSYSAARVTPKGSANNAGRDKAVRTRPVFSGPVCNLLARRGTPGKWYCVGFEPATLGLQVEHHTTRQT